LAIFQKGVDKNTPFFIKVHVSWCKSCGTSHEQMCD